MSKLPLGNNNFAWEWNGFKPIHPRNLNSPEYAKFKIFESCFQYSASDADPFWDLTEIEKLAIHEKVRLIELLKQKRASQVKGCPNCRR